MTCSTTLVGICRRKRHRWLRRRSLALRARCRRNARRGFAWTDSVVTMVARTNAWRAARRKKAGDLTGYAVRSRRIRILTMIARRANATGKTSAKITMVWHVHRQRSVCPSIAWMGFAAATSAWELVKRAARRKKEAARTEHVGASKRGRILTTNAAEVAMVQARATRARNQPFRMGRRVQARRNANRDSARTVCVAIVGV
jgi:hypothetical protein